MPGRVAVRKVSFFVFPRKEFLEIFQEGKMKTCDGFLGCFVKIGYAVLLVMVFQARGKKESWKTPPLEAGGAKPKPSTVPKPQAPGQKMDLSHIYSSVQPSTQLFYFFSFFGALQSKLQTSVPLSLNSSVCIS